MPPASARAHPTSHELFGEAIGRDVDFEEPCPFREIEQTGEVAKALDIAVAGGEQDTSFTDRWESRIGDAGR